ncbi:Acg family FMN-binding oxidoreductase [Pseudonocardia bannensis]|uniref:NAD(P)H nitroreductase n=1 Tax=Pseudonocardia bannensis TaxID=630973 RepID=A0A848DSB0_9PSEU|nr:NAD(P)H nitroreductase [Pseudonocardia bannensis]NMH95405.1 NAD(P)H nitroreductase [Pseudonocardia bannensis]
MIGERISLGTLRAALELAGRAPSADNSQPWSWRFGGRTLQLDADRARELPARDPEGRDMVLSCGAVLHHVRVVLAAIGVTAVVHRLPDPTRPDHLAALELYSRHSPSADLGLAGAIKVRRTDHRRFTAWPVPEGFERDLVLRAADQGAALRPVVDADVRARLVAAIRAAARLPERVSQAAEEVPANMSADRGGPGGPTMRRTGTGTLAPSAVRGEDDSEDGARLYALGTAADSALWRLRAGEAASAVLLHATELGLATSPLSRPLEISGTRVLVRDEVLGGALCPQLLLRIGWAPTGCAPPPPTARRPVDEVLTYLPN